MGGGGCKVVRLLLLDLGVKIIFHKETKFVSWAAFFLQKNDGKRAILTEEQKYILNCV